MIFVIPQRQTQVTLTFYGCVSVFYILHTFYRCVNVLLFCGHLLDIGPDLVNGPVVLGCPPRNEECLFHLSGEMPC